jgi:hypothetical protein
MLIVTDSSYIETAGYDKKSRMLTVGFKSGAVHTYDDVPFGTAMWLHRAPSTGAYFNRKVRGKFAERKL